MKYKKTSIAVLLSLFLCFSLMASVFGYYEIKKSRTLKKVINKSFHSTPAKLIKTPIIEQPYQFACNVTAAAIVLQYRGINKSPDDVYNDIPKEKAEHKDDTWGNPNLGFVGSINGVDGTDEKDGYGLHWDPIAKYLQKYRNAEVKRNWNVKELLQEIDKDNPSILWMHNNSSEPTPLSWTTKDANGNEIEINTIRGMHSEIAIGYVGTPDNPKEIILDDPWASRWDNEYEYLNITEFKRLWNFFNETAVVVK